MKTYHSSFDTGIAGSRAKNMGWLVALYYNNEATPLYFATYDCNLTGAGAAVGNVLDVSGIDSSIDIESAEWSHGRVIISLSDSKLLGTATSALTDKTLSGLLVQKQFKGRAVYVWRINSALTTVTGHDKEFTGFVSDVEMSIDGSAYSFICDSWPEKSRKDLPTESVNETDDPLAPKEAIGQPKPVVYGTFVNRTYSGGELDFLINNFNYAPSVCIDASTGKFIFANHAVHSLADTDIAIYDASLKNYLVGVYAETGGTTRPTVVATSPAHALLKSPTGLKYWTADSIYLIPNVIGGKDDNKTANRQYLSNQSFFDGVATFGATSGTNQYMFNRFLGLSGTTEFPNVPSSSWPILHAYIDAVTGSPDYRLSVWSGISGAAVANSGSVITTTGWKTLTFGTSSGRDKIDASTESGAWTIEEVNRYEYGLLIETIGDTITVRALCLEMKNPIITSAESWAAQVVPFGSMIRNRRIGSRGESNSDGSFIVKSPDRPYHKTQFPNSNDIEEIVSRSAVFAELAGMEFGSWIDDAARSNSYAAGDLINDSTFQIESILRDLLGFGDSDITVAEFDAAPEGRDNTHFSISKFVDSYRLIRELSQATISVTFPASGGKWRHVLIPSDPEGDADSDMTIDWKDITPINFYHTSLEKLCNKLTLRYHLDYGSGQYRKEYIVESTTSQGTTVNGFNHTFEKVISIPYYRFDSSSGATNYAEDAADIYLAHWKNPHGVFEFRMDNHSKLELEEGDKVVFDNFERNIGAIGAGSAGDYWSSIYSPGTIYWMIVKRSPTLDSVVYTAINLHQLV